MEDCALCCQKSRYMCRTCKISLCKQHKLLHQQKKSKDHTFQSLGVKLSPLQISRIHEDLSLKMNITLQCEMHILKETQQLIGIIQTLSTQVLSTIRQKQQIYSDLLKICHKRLISDQLNSIDKELQISLSLLTPLPELQELFAFYTSNFLSESINKIPEKDLSQIFSLSLPETELMLEQDFGLFLRSHTDAVCSLAITSDNKYVLSGSFDKTLRIWNLHTRTQEAVLRDHTNTVSSISTTSDNQYIISGSWTKPSKSGIFIVKFKNFNC